MKIIKKILLVFTFIITVCLFGVNVKAYEIFKTSYKGMITEKDIYEIFISDESFDSSIYKYIYCTSTAQTGQYLYCYAMSEDVKNNLTFNGNQIIINNFDGCGYYHFSIFKASASYLQYHYQYCSISGTTIYDSYVVSNFDFSFLSDDENAEKNVLDFSEFIPVEEEEKQELEITVTGTEILTSMLDKTKNIYEVLIANQLFVLCSCILLLYLVFIILYKVIRK